MGDSASYLTSALTGWIPPDRSFFYGYVIRLVSVTTGSLFPLLLLQTILSAGTAILVAFISRQFLSLSTTISWVLASLCAIDPLQWVWERYVMTETISLFLYALLFTVAFAYLKGRRLWQVLLVTLLGTCLIGFRISFLLAMQFNAVTLPLVAFAPEISTAIKDLGAKRLRLAPLCRPALHLLVSLLAFGVLHAGYQHLNGRLSGQPPAYVYTTGLNLLAMWAPVLKPEDATDPRLAKLIAQGNTFELSKSETRGAQRYREGYLVRLWQQQVPDLTTADKVALETAKNALKRNPLGVAALGLKTFSGFWQFHQLARTARYELGRRPLPKALVDALGEKFHFLPPKVNPDVRGSLLERYFLLGQPYYYVVLLYPIACLAALLFIRSRVLFLLSSHSLILLATSLLFTVAPTVRYLQPISLLAILSLAEVTRWATASKAA